MADVHQQNGSNVANPTSNGTNGSVGPRKRGAKNSNHGLDSMVKDAAKSADSSRLGPPNGSFLNKGGPLPNTIPRKRQDLLKWNGWGYQDTKLSCTSIGEFEIHGDRYPVKKTSITEETRQFMMGQLGFDIYETENAINRQNLPPDCGPYPDPVINKEFVSDLQSAGIMSSLDGSDRLFRGHGHTLYDMVKLREGGGDFERIPDLIVWPNCHDDVVKLVQLATKHNVVIIPFGGGTNVTRALECDPAEKRMIISLDTSEMSRILWVDKANLVACIECGIIGQDLERELNKQGLTTGHEPDSQEFSSLGGWVATRASGMKKNQYGNIEDLVVHLKFVTPSGVLEKCNQAPRISAGPDFNHLVLGSEGTLGVVTEVTLKVRPVPQCREYGSYVFPTFQNGVDFMREVARKRCQPASLRLMDNEQYQFGLMFKESHGFLGSVVESLKMLYLTRWRGFDLNAMSVAIAVYEGDQDEVHNQQKKITQLAVSYGGIYAGSSNGERGYLLTFTIAYIRDICLAHGVLAESFETSVPWDRCANLCRNVKHTVGRECKDRGIHYFIVSCRVTQVYDTGACVYFYFAFNADGIPDALHAYEEIECAAREEILACGGSISHHHGVGKIRQKWYSKQVSTLGVSLYRAVKKQLDPNNIFGCGNLWDGKQASL